MRITLIHNPSAGDDLQPTGEQIVQLIRAAGHKVKYQSSKEKKWKKALEKIGDIVAVAGGDGTIGKVAAQLMDTDRPLAVLPMGTANNIAKTLGLAGKTFEELIEGWSDATYVKFDAGVARGPWGTQCFIEGFGAGLFAEAMARIQEKERAGGPSGNPKQDADAVLTILKKRLNKMQPAKMTVRLDGEKFPGDYLLLEALNIRYVGPNLNLVPRAEIDDGLFDVVFVLERHRAKFKKYLADLIKRKNTRPGLTVRRGKKLQIEWEGSPVHIDDDRWPGDSDQLPTRKIKVEIKIKPGALVLCLPKLNSSKSASSEAGRA